MSEENWYDTIEDADLRTKVSKFESPVALAKSFVEAESSLGHWKANGVRIPGPDATADDRMKAIERLRQIDERVMLRPGEDDPEGEKAFLRSLGVPDDPSEYKAPDDFEGLPEDVQGKADALAVKLGLTKAQYRTLVSDLKGDIDGLNERRSEQTEAQKAQIAKLFGDGAEDKINLVKGMMEHFSHPDMKVDTENLTPEMIAMMARISKEFEGKGRQAPYIANVKGGLSREESAEQAAELHRKLMGPDITDRAERERMVLKYQKLVSASQPA